jgi:hypothetical protein
MEFWESTYSAWNSSAFTEDWRMVHHVSNANSEIFVRWRDN